MGDVAAPVGRRLTATPLASHARDRPLRNPDVPVLTHPALGTRGEGELTDGQLGELVAHRVGAVVLHVDAEDPRPGRPVSEGRRLGLHKARRLAAAGLAVRVAEPPREPGTPKADPDALLLAYGPALLRACALSAPPLAAWALAIGAPPDVAREAGVTEHTEQESRQHEISDRNRTPAGNLVSISESKENPLRTPAIGL